MRFFARPWFCIAILYCIVVESQDAWAQIESDQAEPQLINAPEAWHAGALEMRKPNPERDRLQKIYKQVGVYYDIGGPFFERHDFDTVEKILKERLGKISDPLEAEQYNLMVIWLGLLVYKFEPEDMRAITRQWTELDPDSHFAWLVRGRQAINYAWYWRGGGFANTVTQEGWEHFERALEEARVYLERSYQIEPNDPESSAALVEMCIGGNCTPAEFKQYVDRVCKLVPSHISVHEQVLRSLLPKWGGSWELVDQYLEVLDGKIAAQGHPMLGKVKLSAYRTIAAEREGYADFQRKPEIMSEILAMREAMVKHWPDDLATRAELARAYVIRERFSDASNQFEIIGNRFPADGPFDLVSYHDARLKCLFRSAPSAEPSVVDPILNRMLAIDPEHAGTHQTIGSYRIRFGKYGEAEVSLKRSLELDPTNGATYRMLGTVYENTERYDEAFECVAKAKEYDPSEEGLLRTGRLEKRLLDKVGQDFKPLAAPQSP